MIKWGDGGEEMIRNRSYKQENKSLLSCLSSSVLIRKNLPKVAVWIPGDGMRGD